MLQVGLDMRATESGFKAHAGRGTGRYAQELSKQLFALSALPGAAVCFSPVQSADVYLRPWEETVLSLLPAGKCTISTQCFFPRALTRCGADIIHFFSHGDAPAFPRVPQVVSVLDLIPLRFPDLYQAEKSNMRFAFARWLEYEAIRRARGVIAISESTAKDIEELLGVAAEKIAVTPLAVDERFNRESKDRAAVADLRRELSLDAESPVLLYVGGIDPRKNVLFLLEVFAEVLKASKAGDLPVLALAGRYEDDDQYPALMREIKRLGLSESVRLLGYVPDPKLPLLYALADVFVFPSLYEGFGLPVLEAMACGTPVVAGRNSSLIEVVGHAGVLCQDRDLSAWANEILCLLRSIEERNRLARAGERRAGGFSWSNTAALSLEAYQRFSLGPASDSRQAVAMGGGDGS